MTIVTIPCDVGRHRAVSFHVVGVYGDRVFLADLSADWNGYASLIDAAKEVLRHCNAAYGAGCVICDDAAGDWHQVTRAGGELDIAPYDDDVPFMVLLGHGMAQQHKRLSVGSP